MYHILHVCDDLTPRVAKIAYAAQQHGHQILLLYRRDGCRDLSRRILTVSRWADDGDLAAKLRATAPAAAILHVHTSIATATLADAVRHLTDWPDAPPVVRDLNDWTPEQPPISVDGAICSSAAMTAMAARVAPAATVYSKIPADWAPASMTVPECRAMALISGAGGDNGPVWRDYREAQAWCAAQHVPMMIHPASISGESLLEYRYVQMQLPCVRLWQITAGYLIGWAGAANRRCTIHDCATSKFWEYLGCGIPAFTWRSAEMTRIMADYLPDPREMDDMTVAETDRPCPRRLADLAHPETRHRIQRDPSRFMEAELPALEALYARVLAANGGRRR